MTATVIYDEDGGPASIRLPQDSFDVRCIFQMEGSTAVLKTTEPRSREEVIHGHDLARAMRYVESLPFVQAVTLDGNTEEQKA